MVERFRVRGSDLGHLGPALDVLHRVFREVNATYFVIGATARDLLLEHVYGMQPLRATRDIDVAVAVRSWEEYEAVLMHLAEKHGFVRQREPHRLRRQDLVVDIIPFGEIAAGRDEITWPISERTMSVVGFREVLEAAVGIVIEEEEETNDREMEIPVASLPGIGLMKLIAWEEDPYRRRQDPVDLCMILRGYERVVGERLFLEHEDLLEDAGYDMQEVAARIYGRDMARLIRRADLRSRMLDLLERNTRDEEDSPLAFAMGSTCHPAYQHRLRYLRAFQRGLEEGFRRC